MEKKIRNFFEISTILAIVLFFVVPVVAIKPMSSLDSLGFYDAEIGWIPVDASGSHTIVGHEIFLHEIGQLVTFEIQVSGWSPHLLKAVQASVDSAGYSNGVGDTLNPFGWPGSPEDGCFIDAGRPDYVFSGMVAIDAVYTGDLDYMWGATLLYDGKADDGQVYYLGTLILEVPTNADGTYTIEFLPDGIKTFMQDDNGQKIVPLVLTPASITINKHPNAPIIDGSTSGKVGEEYEYTFSISDPDGDSMRIRIDWGNGVPGKWSGLYTSGSNVKFNHTWDNKGTYTIRAQTQDIGGLESDWGELDVTMPRNKLLPNIFFMRLLERFPNMFPIIRQLMGL